MRRGSFCRWSSDLLRASRRSRKRCPIAETAEEIALGNEDLSMSPNRTQRTGRLRWPEGVDASSATWLALMSLMLFVLLLPFSSYVAALPFIQDEWGLNNTKAERRTPR